jgi:hypothetical protein
LVIPNYQNGSIVNLMSSLIQGLGGRPHPLYAPLDQLPVDMVTDAANVVLLVIDGLGYNYVNRSQGALSEYLRAPITTVFPSSTAPAITTFLTGVAPQQHGVTGWFMHLKELGTVATLLPFRPRWGGDTFNTAGLSASHLIAHPPLFDSLAAQSYFIIQQRLVNSPYTVAAAGRAKRLGYKDLPECLTAIQSTVDQEPQRNYIYAYWPLLDSLSHQQGGKSKAVKNHFHELESGFESLLKALRGTDTLLIITSDHGFIDTAPDFVNWLHDHPELASYLCLPLCGEPRASYCYVHPPLACDFERYVKEQLGQRCDLFTSTELVQLGWFGLGTPSPRLLERIGDYVLIPRDQHVIKDSLPVEAAWKDIGVHGGISEDEMLVPLIFAHC